MTNNNGSNNNNMEQDWKFPLLLSFLAGASTCAGAAIVFVFNAKQIERSMSFSLSLAASVMITVSLISIGPEAMEDVIIRRRDGGGDYYYSVDIPLFLERFFSFASGCFGYWLLSKALAAFPEPESLFLDNNKNEKKKKQGDDGIETQDTESVLLLTTAASASAMVVTAALYRKGGSTNNGSSRSSSSSSSICIHFWLAHAGF